MQFRKLRMESSPKLVIIPMIDVIFFLLIFFMISSLYMMENHNIPVNLPATEIASKTTAVNQTIITINSQGSIYFNQEFIPLNQLTNKAEAAFQENPEQLFILQADQAAIYGQVIAVLDELKKVGIQKVSVATKDKKSNS